MSLILPDVLLFLSRITNNRYPIPFQIKAHAKKNQQIFRNGLKWHKVAVLYRQVDDMKTKFASILLSALLVFSFTPQAWAEETFEEDASATTEAETPIDDLESSEQSEDASEGATATIENLGTIDEGAEESSVIELLEANDSKGNAGYAENEVIVVFEPETESQEIVEILSESEAAIDGDILTESMADYTISVVEIAEETSVSQAIEELSQQEGVAFVQPNYYYYLDATPNDPALLDSAKRWHLESIDAYAAWDKAQSNYGIKVAVIDTGINATHEDLVNNIDTTNAYNAYSKTKGIAAVNDENGHGTHVAGIISAQANNGKGTAGLSYNASIVPIKVTYVNGEGKTVSSTSTIVGAVDYALTIGGVKVINVSMGTEGEGDPLIEACVNRTVAHGVTFVCAAGNTGNSSTTVFPSDCANSISVINLTSENNRNSGSSYGHLKDMAAPGTAIYSTYAGGTASYGSLTGTSMASPVVAGVVALMYTANPHLTVSEVKSILYTTADNPEKGSRDDQVGYGKVNAADAVQLAEDLANGGSLSPLISSATFSSIASQTYTRSQITPKPTVNYNGVNLTENTDYTLSYTSNINAGIATMTVTGTGIYSGTKAIDFDIEALPIGDSSCVIAPISTQTYTGSALTPKPQISHNGKTLTENTDYTLSYQNNTSVGIATITITGKGNYRGTTSTTFSIASSTIELINCTFSTIPAQNFTGSALTPKPTVTYQGKTLAEGTDYTLSYRNNINLGTATVVVTGKNNFRGTKAVEFTITALTVPEGAYVISSALSSSKCIDIAGASTANAANAQMYATNETPAQRFYISFQGAYCTLKNVKSGKVLDVAGAGKANGTNVWQYAGNGSAAQKWILESAGNGYYYLKSAVNGLYLDIAGASTANGANLQVYTGNRTNAQKFALNSCQSINSGTYRMASSLNTSKIVDVSGASKNNGANIQIWGKNGTTAQSFNLNYDSATGYYSIRNVNSGRALDVVGAGTAPGTNVHQYGWNGTWAQRWSIKKNGSNYVLYSACSGLVLDISGGSTANGANVQVYSWNNSGAQKFSIGA